jgi:hypothetical protein
MQVRVSGIIDQDGIRQLWAAIVEACDSYDCYNILGVSDLDMPFSVSDAFDHHEIFNEVGVGPRHRIAWVNKNSTSDDILEFTETVLLNRGQLNGGLFPSIDGAKQWLRNEPDLPAR